VSLLHSLPEMWGTSCLARQRKRRNYSLGVGRCHRRPPPSTKVRLKADATTDRTRVRLKADTND